MRKDETSHTNAWAIRLLALLCAAPVAAEEAAAPRPEQPKKQYRWGVGWDEGIAFRVRLQHGWGLGLRVNPDLVNPDRTGTDSSKIVYTWSCSSGPGTCKETALDDESSSSKDDARTFGGAVMVYHETKLGKWLTVGPYLAGNYQRSRETTTVESQGQMSDQSYYPYARIQPLPDWQQGSSTTTTVLWQRTLGIELGVRPTFQFHERFVLETRFGLELAFTKSTQTDTLHAQVMSDSSAIPAGVPVPAQSTSTNAGDETITQSGSQHRFHTVGERLGPGAQLRFVVLF